MSVSKFLISVIVIFIFILNLNADEKSYSINRVDISAQLNPDGSMLVTENRTFSFNGKFKYIYRTFPKQEGISFNDITIKEGLRVYKESDSRQVGTTLRTESEKEIKFKSFISARDEIRTFEITYTVSGALKKYQDTAVLYYQFISPEWKKTQHNVWLNIYPPEKMAGEELKHWLHGPLWGESRHEHDGTITAWCQVLPGRSFFEIRALYPVELFPQVSATGGYVKKEILDQEYFWAEEANLKRQEAIHKRLIKKVTHEMGSWLMPMVALCALVIWLVIFGRYGIRKRIPKRSDILAEPPAKTPPAMIEYLLNSRSISGASIMSTLLDLANRGFLIFKHDEIEKKPGKFKSEYFLKFNRDFFQNNQEELKEHESALLSFLFDELQFEEDTIPIKKLKKHRRKFVKFFSKWKKKLFSRCKEQDWIDKDSIKGGNYSVILGVFFTVISIISLFWFGPWSFLLLGISLVILILSIFIPHFTEAGAEVYQDWKAYRKYLRKLHFQNEEPAVVQNKINDYLVYGTVFHLSKKVFRELSSMIPAEQYQTIVPWYLYAGSRPGGFSGASFSQALTTMLSSTGTAMSSASGAGGGASAGGGGGAGSGGGGAG